MAEFIVIDQRDHEQMGSFPTLHEAIEFATSQSQIYARANFWIEKRELVWSSDHGDLTGS